MADMRIIEVRYIGRCKQRDNGDSTAFGWSGGQWSVIFPEQTLRDWFESPAPDAPKINTTTLYSVLGAKPGDSFEALKTAYRRMAMQWHPDRCKEPGAHDMFLKVQDAYNVLSNPTQKLRYDAGLAMAASVKKQEQFNVNKVAAPDPYGYRAPLKSGWILTELTRSGRYLVVSKILEWQDVLDSQGRVLVSSWIMGDKQPTENWY
jgi:hypothetical protein